MNGWHAMIQDDLEMIFADGPSETVTVGGIPVKAMTGSVDFGAQSGMVESEEIEAHILRSDLAAVTAGAAVVRADGSRWRVAKVLEYDPWVWVLRLDREMVAL
ncbi:MAG: hypothetical protein GX751_07420 [Desulfuromonadaceae bacterium]|nr:hypothetical protein [Desulfuromonadaceae bacterium]